MSRTYRLSSSLDDSRLDDNEAAKTLQYVSVEIEGVMRLLKTVEFSTEPQILQGAITRIIRGIGGIQTVITTHSNSVGLAGKAVNNAQTAFADLANASDSYMEGPISESNESFIRSLKNTITHNLANTELGVDQLSRLMNMSRRNLFRRIKFSTGLSPAELINEIRLRTARKLLLEADLKMYEIAERVGFKSRIVFTRNFTRWYGASPSEFLKNHKYFIVSPKA
jgi:AraC-like DNA-binding protein